MDSGGRRAGNGGTGPAYEGMGARDSPPRRSISALCELGSAAWRLNRGRRLADGRTVLGCADLGGRARPLAEVGGARDAAVVTRPAFAVGERLLDPIEAAEPPTEIVDHVHERRLACTRDDRRAMLELSVVREDDVQHGLRRLGGEAGQLLDRAAHEVVAERYLAVQLAGVRQLYRATVHRVRLDLADVVQQRPGDCDVAVEAGERRGEGMDTLGDREAVLEQPVPVGLVVVLGRRRVRPTAEQLRALAEEAIEQPGEVGVADVREQLAKPALHDLDREGGRLHQVRRVEAARWRLA